MRPIHAIATAAAAALLAACGSDEADVAAEDARTGEAVGAQTEIGTTTETGPETETDAETATGGETETRTGGEAEPTTIEIVETSFDLSSPRVEMEGEVLELGLAGPGTYTFRVVNEASIPHALAISGPGVDEETGNIPGGQTTELTVTFEQPGEYDVWCPIGSHRELGMDGAIVVGEGETTTDAESQSGSDGSGGVYGEG